MSEDKSVERLSVAEAAEALGITRDAIPKRTRRDSIEHEQGADGRFYVFVDTSATGAERSTDVSIDDRTDLLIAEMQDRIRSLEEANRENRRIIAALTQRIPEIEPPRSPVEHLENEEALREEAEMEARDAETRHSGHFQRYGAPRRETPSEPQGAPEMAADEQQGRRGPLPDATSAQEPTERVSWWRRMFGEG